MAETTTALPTDSDRAALFEKWLKPIAPAKPAPSDILDKISPWRRNFLEARRHGFSWIQLAKEVAPQGEIGVKVSGQALKKLVASACKAANEPFDDPTEKHRRRRKKIPPQK